MIEDKKAERIPTPFEQHREKVRRPGEVTVRELARMAGVSYDRIYKLAVQMRQIPYRRDGAMIFLSREAAETYLNTPRRPAGRPRVRRYADDD